MFLGRWNSCSIAFFLICLCLFAATSPATGTGTLVIDLENVNDNAPVINERNINVCNRGSAPVLLSITDKDGPPFAAPFSVETHGETSKNWSTSMNKTCEQLLMF